MICNRQRIAAINFGILIFVGLGFMFWGIVMAGVVPYFLLDVVLTEQELKDPAKQEATLTLLKKATAGDGPAWIVEGLFIAIVSGIGLMSICGLSTQSVKN